MKIIADSAIPFLRGVLEPWATVEYLDSWHINALSVHDAQALIIRTRSQCNKSLLEHSSVEMIATATIGFDHIDTLWCAQRSIEVATSAGCNARGVLQWIGATLHHLSLIQGWQPKQITLGIVGVGHVGSLVKEYALMWGFRVICCDPPRQRAGEHDFVDIDELVANADIITLHTPLDQSTHHLINGQLLSRAKPHAAIINSSRGAVVDNHALNLCPHPFAFDVWEGEPNLDPTLIERALIATPHIAGYSLQGKAAATAMAVESIARHFGLPLKGWYPPQIPRSTPRPCSWQELCNTITDHYPIAKESAQFKTAPQQFESLRDHYQYRVEYF